MNLYLGCIHHRKEVLVGDQTFNVIEYDMADFLKSAVQLYRELFPDTAG